MVQYRASFPKHSKVYSKLIRYRVALQFSSTSLFMLFRYYIYLLSSTWPDMDQERWINVSPLVFLYLSLLLSSVIYALWMFGTQIFITIICPLWITSFLSIRFFFLILFGWNPCFIFIFISWFLIILFSALLKYFVSGECVTQSTELHCVIHPEDSLFFKS